MSIFGNDDPASEAVEETLRQAKRHVDVIFSVLRCNTCEKESKISSCLQLLLLSLSQEPDAKNVARDLRQYVLDVRREGGQVT